MVRPGLMALVEYLTEIGATMVVYTHSEHRWASKVCQAMEKMAGINFIRKLFSRQDCKDGHPEFAARKSLHFVAEQLNQDPSLAWVHVQNMILFDDDGTALGAGEETQLVRVPSYDYWEACKWDEVITPELLQKQNDPDLVERVRRSVVEWGPDSPTQTQIPWILAPGRALMFVKFLAPLSPLLENLNHKTEAPAQSRTHGSTHSLTCRPGTWNLEPGTWNRNRNPEPRPPNL